MGYLDLLIAIEKYAAEKCLNTSEATINELIAELANEEL